jgi:tRNA G10  N-methylase Trm11
MTIAFILGSHPDLSLAELTAVLESQRVPFEFQHRHHDIVLLDLPPDLDLSALMVRLGGTIKIIEMLGEFDPERLTHWLFEQINPETKFHFGFSLYSLASGVRLQKDWKVLQQLGLTLKRTFKSEGISARYVQSKEVVLSSVIVHKERLLKNGVEIDLFKQANGAILVGRTRAVQAFGAFTTRDYGRPAVDAKSGMLPPKLARMMVNLARQPQTATILDPFCGSGTVLQEAWDLGYRDLYGSDASDKAITDTRKNLDWLGAQTVKLTISPAQDLILNQLLPPKTIDAIIFEGWLGPTTPTENRLPNIIRETTKLYQAVWPVLAQLLRPGGIIVAALPCWQIGNKSLQTLPLSTIYNKTGLRVLADPLVYRRPQSIVGRHIVQLKRVA